MRVLEDPQGRASPVLRSQSPALSPTEAPSPEAKPSCTVHFPQPPPALPLPLLPVVQWDGPVSPPSPTAVLEMVRPAAFRLAAACPLPPPPAVPPAMTLFKSEHRSPRHINMTGELKSSRPKAGPKRPSSAMYG
ncbi:hypothetical protein COCON_G00218810 [Conger conger]|uniref:Uncharacterized protein n=1 Tax=Conger conger TaxID=82655 RepID=A0A9Q1CZ08_CONCO|nr:hypothetical protein COCON_G00218810 [Conger conger]